MFSFLNQLYYISNQITGYTPLSSLPC